MPARLQFLITIIPSVLLMLGPLPAWSADELTLSVTTKTSYPEGYKDSKGSHKAGSVETKTETKILTVAPTWFSYGKPEQYAVFDFEKHKITNVDKGRKMLSTLDMHSMTDFRVAEAENRQALGKVLSAAKTPMSMGSDFEIESYFGLEFPGATKAEIKRQSKDETTSFIVDGKPVAAVRRSAEAVASGYEKSYRHFLTYGCHLHPQIVATISGEPHYFAELHTEGIGDAGVGELEIVDMKLIRLKPGSDDALPIPTGFSVEQSAELAPVYAALAKLGPNPKLPSKAEVDQFIQNALADDRVLDALLETCEQTWISTDDMADEMRRLRPKIMLSPPCMAFIAAVEKVPNKDEIDKVEKDVQSIDRSKLQRAEAIDVVLANDLTGVGRVHQAEKLMTKALTQNPLLIGAYLDLWRIFCMEYQQGDGWECIDIVRKLAPDSPRLNDVKQIEQLLEKDFPQFF